MFSFNVEGGRCNTCKGDGFLTIDMQFLPDVMMRCPDCRGTRYRPEVLEITYRGRNIAEVLELTAREAFVFFRHRPKIQARLRPLLDIGLDYLRLGQPAATLSGGEAQRLKLAGFLGSSTAALNRAGNVAHTVFILDEPTAGLHPFDMLRLIDALNSLVDRGHSVIVIEHSPELMICADWIIDLGPGAGDEGGRIVAQGTPRRWPGSGTLTGAVIARGARARGRVGRTGTLLGEGRSRSRGRGHNGRHASRPRPAPAAPFRRKTADELFRPKTADVSPEGPSGPDAPAAAPRTGSTHKLPDPAAQY